MQRVALIYNPASGQHSRRRAATVKRVLALLKKAGIETEALETDAPGSARKLARAAVRNGFDTVFACGGDGTVHEVLQSLVGTSVALGVVPLGTANALAQNLGLGISPAKAVRKLLAARPCEFPVGRIWYRDPQGVDRSSYFTVAAGIGADAMLMASMDAGLKRRFGYLLYLIEGARIWATNSFPLFRASFALPGETRVVELSQLLAVRVRSFGGALGKLAPNASMHSSELNLICFKTRSRYRYMRFLLAVIAGRHTFSKDIELLEAATVQCRLPEGSKSTIYVEADGEVLGFLPAKMELSTETVSLLVPEGAEP